MLTTVSPRGGKVVLHRKFLWLVLLVVLATLPLGCSKLTRKNYEKLKGGMEYEEVVKILGEPDECTEALFAKNCTWGSERKTITVSFIGGKIMLYASKNIK
jgi:Domain of Unknown Function with PDB structure (DUF3862)